MSKIALIHQKAYQWHEQAGVFVKGFVMTDDGRMLKDAALASFFANCQNEKDLLQTLRSANGLFAVVLQREDGWVAATDHARTFPLFYREHDGDCDVSDDVDALLAPNVQKKMDKKAAHVFRFTGFTIGRSTLLENVSQIQAGEMVHFCNGNLKRKFYFRFAQEKKNITYDETKQQLKRILHNVGKRLVASLGGRPVAVPLSGGYDSRLIVYLLHQQNYPQVTCFTYGKRQKNQELVRAQRIAKQLGYPWFFVEYPSMESLDLSTDPDFLAYNHYASQYCMKSTLSEYIAARKLHDSHTLTPDTVILPGHSGDTIAGSHLRPYMLRYRNDRQVVKDLIYTHFHLFKTHYADRREFISLLNDMFRQYDYADLSYSDKVKTWVLRERHGKFIINSCRMWDYMGWKFLLPLRDSELVDFFASLPAEFRLHKKLYEEVLWELFRKEGILYEDDRKSIIPDGWKERLKLFIKRNAMFFQPYKDIFAHDMVGIQYLLKGMKQEIAQRNVLQDARNLNAIMTEWYLLHLEKEIEKQDHE